jgi:eukaryotic-like serine/threonine-protein kinase
MGFDLKKIRNNTLAGVILHFVLAVATFVLLAIFYFYVYLPNSTNHGETITVPNIEGKTIDQLERELSNRNLRYEINDSSYSDKHEPLTVIKQYPHAGSKVKEGRKIFISLNASTPPTVPVPNLIDGSVVNAEAVLKSNQLKRGRIELVPGPFNIVKEMKFKGSVITPTTRVPKGSTIDLVVMTGKDNEFPTPDLLGMEFNDAKTYILGANLSIADPIVVGDTLQRKPVIIKQKPEPGENITVGDPVQIWIGAPGTEPPSDDDETDDET